MEHKALLVGDEPLLREMADQARQSKFLATIVLDAPVKLDLEACRTGQINRDKVIALFRELEFRTLVDPPAAALAATRANRHQRIGINAAFQRMVHAGTSESAQALAEEALQTAIVDASGDELLRQMGSVVRVGLRSINAARAQAQTSQRATDAEVGDYGRVVRAIEVADGEGARAAMSQVLARAASNWMEEAV